ncbi:MAG: nickel-dependent hydrogenase large subunit [Methanomassiliicoccus sp.]|nr:nickel-dependent hydrogenase large subunit [Methanomassiliicoccus sp.]
MGKATTIPFGPQHAAFLEPLNVKLTLDEETVVGAELNQGYNHRGMEYALSLDYKKSQYLAERVCGICSYHHSSAYCQGVEAIYGLDVPARAKLIRTIMMECQRLTSHLLALGHIAEAVGYENLFMQCFREREYVMMLVNRISGNRVHYSMNVVGGVKRDLDGERVRDIQATMRELRPRLEELQRVFGRDGTLSKRTRGVGKLSKREANEWGTVGPVARASGIDRDIRQDGFAAYSLLRFAPVVREEGDCYARMMVRMDECLRAVDIIEQSLPLLEDGPVAVQVKGHPKGESFSRVEAPRGELMYYINAKGTLALERIKLRTPALMNVASLLAMLPGCQLADVPTITVSVDPCICCTDR